MLKMTMNTNIELVDQKRDNHNNIFLDQIEKLDSILNDQFSKAMIIDENLTRKLVSFQANKVRTYYRWYKYKEAFSADLVEYLFHKYRVKKGKILDPFAGAGTALFACSSLGYHSEGIEVLPIGHKIIEANILARSSNRNHIIVALERWLSQKPWNSDGKTRKFEKLRITEGAYPQETDRKIERYLYEIENEEPETKEILLFALLCVLESISYTRKDGQYLRWDYRSARTHGKKSFDKGKILYFDEAVSKKLYEIKHDMAVYCDRKADLFSFMQEDVQAGTIELLKGSCLNILPILESGIYSGIITSPPYCNRYDYTRTYALELALLGVTDNQLSELRQSMLSCTVENKAKELIDLNTGWQRAIDICDNHILLQMILSYLDYKKNKKELNNNGIARMVRSYFYEMACVIQECYRVLNDNGMMFMVNDNVRYAGTAIAVDTILSKIAESVGFNIENILVLPQGKGNSSQQMGRHGREVLRKCIYVWKKRK
jgi:DNA modification methylase